jgi:anti-sigma B factor antagonist
VGSPSACERVVAGFRLTGEDFGERSPWRRTVATEEGQADYAVDLHPSNDGVVVALGGELDFMASPYLRESLIEAVRGNPRNLRIDLSAVSFLDSVAVGLLVSTRKRVNAYDGAFSVKCGHAQMRRVLEIMGLIEYLNVDSAG